MITCDQLELEFKNEFEKGFGRIHSTFNNGEEFLLFHKHHQGCVRCASNATHCDTWWLLQLPLWTCLYQCRTVQINLFRSYTDPHTINIQMNIIWRLFLYHSNFDPRPTDRSIDYWLKYIGSSEIYSEIMKADKYNIQVELGRRDVRTDLLELAVYEWIISALLFQEFFVRSNLNNFSIVNNCNLVSINNCRQTMCNQNACSTLTRFV